MRLPMVKGVVFLGGPNRVVDGSPVQPDAAILSSGIPCLAVGCPDLREINREAFDEVSVRSFVFDVCGCETSWTMEAFIDEQVRQLRAQIGGERVFREELGANLIYVDAMTTTVAHPDWALLERITQRIITEVKGVNRVVYDLTPKPTGTIEWE